MNREILLMYYYYLISNRFTNVMMSSSTKHLHIFINMLNKYEDKSKIGRIK